MNFKITRYLLSISLFLLISLLTKAQIVSDFSLDIDGWSTYGDFGGAAPGTPIYQSSGGNPGGCIKQTDNTVGVWYWYGPSKFRGDLGAFIDCTFSYDLKQSHISVPVNYYDLMIFNTGTDTMTYHGFSGPSPVNTWYHYEIALSTGVGWKYGSSSGGVGVTTSQLSAIMNDIKRIRIRAEYEGLWSETDYLDNVKIICPVVLPVELVSFTATDAGNAIAHLNWTTQTETNCLGYIIEKSKDLLVFDSIGFIYGNGTSTDLNYYDFYDEAFITTSYYRLKQVDLDYKGYYSDIVSLHSAIQVGTATKIFPNPAKDYILIVANESEPLLFYEITDMLGRIIIREAVDQYDGYFQKKLDLTHYSPGIYTVTLYKNSGIESRKFEIVK